MRNFRVYLVEHVNGNWLWLKTKKEDVKGWVKVEYVIPFDQAIGYFSDQIRARPNEPAWYTDRGTIWQEKGESDALDSIRRPILRWSGRPNRTSHNAASY
jgi:hypothetical protein